MGGYQIGFTNPTKQGMSGGALLNEEGKVIGVLGLGAAAILDNAYLYADGSRPDAQMLKKLRENSFAVPVASLTARNDLSTTLATTKPNQSTKYQGMVGKIDSIAQQITVRINSKNNGNGSGVIIAQDGDTYIEEKPGQYEEVALGYSLGIPSKKLLNVAKLTDIPVTALKQENSLPLELTDLEIDSIKGQLFNFKVPGKNATETDWLNYGNQLWRASEFEKAEAAFNRAISINPQQYRAYYGKGLATRSIDAFKQTTKLAPSFAAAWQKLAGLLSFYGNSQNRTNLLEALPAYNRAIQLEPKLFTNYIRRGSVLKNLQRYDEAIAI